MWRRFATRGAFATAGVAGAAYAVSPGFRRSVCFWSTVAPFVGEYQSIRLRARWERWEPSELEAAQQHFHHRSALRAVDVILRLGGIYIKIGQFASTMGAGVLEDAYIQALRPLQDGVPPRSLTEVSRIIEADIGVPMGELFSSFDPEPVGAASIAQAHRATLLDGREVIVKVQYPEVPTLYEADFDNLEIVTRFLFPENLPLIEGLRKRHQAELDFRQEARNLAEVRANLSARGFEPSRARLDAGHSRPLHLDPRLPTSAREGASSAASALPDIGRVLPVRLVRLPSLPDERLCSRHVLAMELLHGTSLAAAIDLEAADIAAALGLESADAMRKQLLRRMGEHFERGGGATRLLSLAEAAAPLVRLVAATLRLARSAAASTSNALARCMESVGLGGFAPPLRDPPERRHDLSRALRTLVRVHGVAMLLDGVYNADPHPGNVLLLPDGRLGLIDYGMCGRLEGSARESIARVVLGLAAGDRAAVVDTYERSGYRACWHGGAPHGPDAVYRFATFHLDRIDLSPVGVGPGGEGGGGSATMPVMKLLRSTIEVSVPDWVEQARRLGGLLIGVGSQAGRPISLAHEWAPIAEEVLASAGGARAADARRLRTHLTGLSA
ncbi:hypothetical protein EMIHUDRAFT_444785 [Emiliania huxleyi CCMP1516]|uniref:ABC1 atypical kinase-like domain-containing protein n=2 Tax=Emiliania huxleyi TaxID=2903 RepID=A0A0D3J8R4_EMIH1|nr:hypothetical protein EMIHUDRAFT_444785 [Emiliania huxleyi CCMP1516]EOD19899.1 hypothetical protein EMIHUDRAFT_444785 [Emiliania huxleyi CCMP1516]|eukprot:XP_005772328.1 hypothetical protein EMIHUDRAFT_444785 [Emiliania huxleyi CCMP1516]